MKAPSDILLEKMFASQPVNLLDYAGNLRHELCYKATLALALEKDPAQQLARAQTVVASMRDMGQAAWAELLIGKYFTLFKINYAEASAE